MEPAPTPRVLLADDDKSILERTCAILCEFEVVGMVRYGRDAIAEVQRLDPDMLVIDISMPILYGLQAASQLQSICCRTKVVFLTFTKIRTLLPPRSPLAHQAMSRNRKCPQTSYRRFAKCCKEARSCLSQSRGLPVSLFRLRGGISFPPWPRLRRPPIMPDSGISPVR